MRGVSAVLDVARARPFEQNLAVAASIGVARSRSARVPRAAGDARTRVRQRLNGRACKLSFLKSEIEVLMNRRMKSSRAPLSRVRHFSDPASYLLVHR